MAEKNPWRSVDENGYDWNSGEEFDPAPKASDAPTQSAQTTPAQSAQTTDRQSQAAAQSVPAAQQPAQRTLPQSADSAALSQQAARTVENNRRSYADTGTFRGYLDDWLNSAREQSESRIDRGVTRGVNELARVQEDAQEGFQTQRNQINADERRALDNRALYDAMRGDRGGIGAEQYSSIQNAAMQARVTVNSAQTKLANDTRRQIAELRANGEFQKSQEILQLNQEYISRLSALEQWAMDYNAGVDQFNAALDQWLASYNFQLRQLDLSQYQWEQSFAYQKEVDERNYNRSVFESDRAFGYQQGRDAVLDARDERNFNFQRRQYDDSREDAAWQKGVTERQLANDEAHTKWQQGITERQLANDEANTRWQQGMTERQYADSREDAAWQRGVTERQLAASQLSNLKEYVMTTLSNGYMVDDATLKEAGIDKNYASLIVSNARNAAAFESEKAAAELENKRADTANKQASALKSAAGVSGTGGKSMSLSNAEKQADEGVWTDTVYNTLIQNGYDAETIEARYGNDKEFQSYIVSKQGRESGEIHFDWGPDEGVYKIRVGNNTHNFANSQEFVDYVNSYALSDAQRTSLFKQMSVFPELTALFGVR